MKSIESVYHNRIKNSCKKIFLLILSDTHLVQSVCWSLYNNLFRKWPRSINLPLLRNKNTHHGLPGIQQFVSQMTIIKKSQKVPSVTHSTEQYKIHWGSSTLQIYSKVVICETNCCMTRRVPVDPLRSPIFSPTSADWISSSQCRWSIYLPVVYVIYYCNDTE